ncbi:hypothetical protein GSI_06511 [Ganoderma sinense ZZ0214-1]|uniref:Uncharacterized protein n=1 Tax=Ganoderma sinense ZZ0214-1 TaxID=1077348 RepID=A0A2G8SDK7_9APHY|nr:hypothetical protein GSI_06511 [Ganoderma sinense ZZ0214-1]
MESPRAQELIADLRHDAFANAILDRVQAGPYLMYLSTLLCETTDAPADSPAFRGK